MDGWSRGETSVSFLLLWGDGLAGRLGSSLPPEAQLVSMEAALGHHGYPFSLWGAFLCLCPGVSWLVKTSVPTVTGIGSSGSMAQVGQITVCKGMG